MTGSNQFVGNYLIGERPDAILNIIDGTNLERNLYLTTQLTELGIPVVLAVNMMDLVQKNGKTIPKHRFSGPVDHAIAQYSTSSAPPASRRSEPSSGK